METKVVHCRKSRYDVYIGRPGPFGNLFEIGIDGTRKEVLKKYKEWLLGNPEMLEAIKVLKGKVLGCWCKNEDGSGPACHGDVIAEILDGKICLCKPNKCIINPCKGECGCLYCKESYQDFMSLE